MGMETKKLTQKCCSRWGEVPQIAMLMLTRYRTPMVGTMLLVLAFMSGCIEERHVADVTQDAMTDICTLQGSYGLEGPQGPIGPEGPEGPEGPQGPTGPEGPEGTEGLQGPTGPEGPEGTEGPQGPTGSEGPEGPEGLQGPTGPEGPQGPSGSQGPKGDPGTPGPNEVTWYTEVVAGRMGSYELAESVTFGEQGSGGYIGIWSAGGKEVVELGGNSAGGGALVLYNDAEEQSTYLGTNTAGAGYLGLSNAASTTVVSAGENSAGRGYLATYNAQGTNIARLTSSSNSGAGYIEVNNASGTRIISMTTLANDTCGHVVAHSSNGEGKAGISGTGIVWGQDKQFRIASPGNPDEEIVYHCIEGPGSDAFLRGRGILMDGFSEVVLPEHWRHVVGDDPATVQLTPHSGTSLGLAVEHVDPYLLRVVELHGGHGSYEFSYRIEATRDGMENIPVIQPAMHLSIPESDALDPG